MNRLYTLPSIYYNLKIKPFKNTRRCYIGVKNADRYIYNQFCPVIHSLSPKARGLYIYTYKLQDSGDFTEYYRNKMKVSMGFLLMA